MKARSTWPTAFLLVFLGCGSGTVGGPGYTGGGESGSGGGSTGNGGSAGAGGGSTGVGVGSGGAGVGSGSTAGSGGTGIVPCVGCTVVDGGVIEPDGSFMAVTPPSPTPPSGGVVVQPLTKLTAAEYANTVNDLFGSAIGLATSMVPPSAQTVPLGADTSAGGFSIGGAATDQTAQAYHDSALVIANVVTSATNLPTLVKAACPTLPAANSGGAGATCASAFINELAPLAFRHGTVDAATIMGLNNVYQAVAVTDAAGFSGGIAAVIEEMLQSPYFLYHLETEQQALGTTAPVPVTGYSLANRLSYLLWSSMPDSALFTAA